MLLRRLARRSGRSKSDVIREALNRLAEESTGGGVGGDLYASVADLMGCIRGGARALLEMIQRKALVMPSVDDGDLTEISGLMRKYADLPMDFANATVARVAMREDMR